MPSPFVTTIFSMASPVMTPGSPHGAAEQQQRHPPDSQNVPKWMTLFPGSASWGHLWTDSSFSTVGAAMLAGAASSWAMAAPDARENGAPTRAARLAGCVANDAPGRCLSRALGSTRAACGTARSPVFGVSRSRASRGIRTSAEGCRQMGWVWEVVLVPL